MSGRRVSVVGQGGGSGVAAPAGLVRFDAEQVGYQVVGAAPDVLGVGDDEGDREPQRSFGGGLAGQQIPDEPAAHVFGGPPGLVVVDHLAALGLLFVGHLPGRRCGPAGRVEGGDLLTRSRCP
jgi:hypothetical protein